MQNANKGTRNELVVAKEMEEAKEHMRFCFRLYTLQVQGRRYFVYEHPSGASPCSMPEVIERLHYLLSALRQ